MWKVERVITHFDFAKGFFSFVDKGKLLYNLGISEEMFLDVAIISGFDWIETFPVIDVKQGGDTIFDFSYALDIGILSFSNSYFSKNILCVPIRRTPSSNRSELYSNIRSD
jgi:hypothetical protein